MADLTVDESKIRSKVQQLLESTINPAVAGHGGQVKLLDVKGSSVYIEMSGGCQGCGMAMLTLRQGIERSIREQIPEVTAVLDQTDHASGRNPYFSEAPK